MESSKVIVIFDVDGTINQTEVYAVKAYRKALEEVGKKNRKTVVEKYSIQNNHSKYIDFYNSIVK